MRSCLPYHLAVTQIFVGLFLLLSTGCGHDKAPRATCVEGAACETSNPCTGGIISCATGSAVCAQTARPDGTSCGDDLTCQGGVCGCAQGEACPASPCHVGAIACQNGEPVCVETAAADGTSCGTHMVCSAGSCLCDAGAGCVTGGGCHTGDIACNDNTPTCIDNGGLVPDDTPCGTYRACQTGACVCHPGETCSTSICTSGAIVCNGDDPVCNESPIANGTPCGRGMSCAYGSCMQCVDVSGVWSSIETTMETLCETSGTTRRVYSITQTDCSLSINDLDHAFTGVAYADQVYWTESYPYQGGTVSSQGTVTVSNAEVMQGTGTYTWTDGVTSCYGMEAIDAARGAVGLLATGQTTCFDTNHQVVDCLTTPGQDGALQKRRRLG